MNLELCWIRGHNDVPGNLIVDRLARSGDRTWQEKGDEVVGIQMAGCKVVMRNELLAVAQEDWSGEATCEVSRLTWPGQDYCIEVPIRRDSGGCLDGALPPWDACKDAESSVLWFL